jgi:hypothetical protein
LAGWGEAVGGVEDFGFGVGEGFAWGGGEGVFGEGADEGDGDVFAHLGIDGCAEENVGFFGDEFEEALHEQLDFEEGEVFAAGEVDEDGLGVFEERALIEEWAGEGVFEGFGGAVFAVGEAGAEEAAGAGGAEGGHEVVEADVDEAGADDEADDGFDGFADHVVCGGEGFVDALFGEDELAHAVVVEGDECVGEDGEFVEGGFGLFAAAAAFEGEGHGGEDDDEGSFFAGEAGDDGSGSGAGATAEAGAEEDDAAAFEGGADFVFGFEDGLVAEFGITTGAEAFGEVSAELDFFVGDAGG